MQGSKLSQQQATPTSSIQRANSKASFHRAQHLSQKHLQDQDYKMLDVHQRLYTDFDQKKQRLMRKKMELQKNEEQKIKKVIDFRTFTINNKYLARNMQKFVKYHASPHTSPPLALSLHLPPHLPASIIRRMKIGTQCLSRTHTRTHTYLTKRAGKGAQDDKLNKTFDDSSSVDKSKQANETDMSQNNSQLFGAN